MISPCDARDSPGAAFHFAHHAPKPCPSASRIKTNRIAHIDVEAHVPSRGKISTVGLVCRQKIGGRAFRLK